MRLIRKFIAAAVVTLSFGALALGYSSPGNPTGFVNDFAGAFDPSWVRVQNASLQSFEKQTGVEIAVVTVPSLGGDTVENYAVKLFEEWKIGKKGKDNGLLLLLAMSDREVRIEVGYGLEGTITDAESFHIIQDLMIPELKKGDTERAVFSALNAIESKISGASITGGTQQTAFEQAYNAYRTNTASRDEIPLMFVVAFIGAFVVGITRFIEFLVRGKEKKLWWLVIILALAVGFGTLLLPGTTNDDAMTVTLINLFLYNIIYWLGEILLKILLYASYFSGGGSGRGGSSGGFGGFGGGRSGGGGASGRW